MYIGVGAFTPISPTANAGPDQTFNLPTNIANLVGLGSSPDGTIVSYAWTQVSGPSCTIASPLSPNTGVTGMNTAGSYVFQLQVTDNHGLTATDLIDIVVASVTDAVITASMGQNSTQFTIEMVTSIPLAVDVVINFCGNITQGGELRGCGGGNAPGGSLTLLAGTLSISGVFGTVDHDLGTITDFGFSSVTVVPTNDGIRNITTSFPT